MMHHHATAVLLLNGPNLDLLGERETELYGEMSLGQLEASCAELGEELGLDVQCMQSNHEGVLIEEIHRAGGEGYAVILNAGAYSHTSLAIADAIHARNVRVIEVHITNVHRREPWRQRSYVSQAAEAVICGCGPTGYHLALRYLASKASINPRRQA